MANSIIILIACFIGLFVLQILFFLARYKTVSPDKLLVIFGRVSEDANVKYIIKRSGGHFVWPVIQDFLFLDLKISEHTFEIKAEDGKNQFVDLSFIGAVAIGDSEELISNYLKRLQSSSEELATNQLQGVVRSELKKYLISKEKAHLMINLNKTKSELSKDLSSALAEIGHVLISINSLEIA